MPSSIDLSGTISDMPQMVKRETGPMTVWARTFLEPQQRALDVPACFRSLNLAYIPWWGEPCQRPGNPTQCYLDFASPPSTMAGLRPRLGEISS